MRVNIFRTHSAYRLKCRAEKLALDVEEKALIMATLQREWAPKLSEIAHCWLSNDFHQECRIASPP